MVPNKHYQKVTNLGHILMFLLLILAITLYIKEYMINSKVTYAEYSYIWAFGVPMILIILVTSDIIYEKFIAKLE